MSHKIESDQYAADFEISKRFIDFSAELLRLSLLILGGLGALVFNKPDNHLLEQISAQPTAFRLCMILLVISASAALAHRYCATDSLSWFISLLRAQAKNDQLAIEKEKKGFYRMLFLSRASLITCEVSFALAVIAFIITVVQLT
jgi:hypothetical protein